jgi:hypothetical protein
METPRTVVLCGSSLFLAGVAASLVHRPELALVRVDTADVVAWPALAALRPAAVIVDRSEVGDDRLPAIDQLVSWLPGVLIVSLDLASSVATLLTSRRRSLCTADEVVAAIAEG